MLRIGLVTLNSRTNLGNRLQNYALKRVLEELGADEVVSIRSPFQCSPDIYDSATRRLLNSAARRTHRVLTGGSSVWNLKERRQALEKSATEYLRGASLSEGLIAFTANYLNEAGPQFSFNSEFNTFSKTFDRFVVGSDQVWNPSFGLPFDLAFLRFSEPSRRIAYAASFGVAEIPQYLRKPYVEGLRGMPHISVREHRASELARDLVGVSAPVVLDPTLLISSDNWREMLPRRKNSAAPEGKYVLKFSLDPDRRLVPIESFSQTHPGVAILDYFDLVAENKEFANPLSFLKLISNADAVLTDSFHGSVFSLVFHVPVFVEPRGNMASRLETLSIVSGVKFPSWDRLPDLHRSVSFDWERVESEISHYRIRSLEYLSGAI